MKNIFGAILLFLAFQVVGTVTATAQFRTDNSKEPTLNTADAMKGDGDSFFSKLFDPSRFSMHQTYSMSMGSSSIGSYGLSMFTNTFSYKASSDLMISADVSAVYSPFNSFSGPLGDNFSKSVNGVYLTSARLDWKLSDNTTMRIEYQGGPQNGLMDGMYGYDPYGYSYGSNPVYLAPRRPAAEPVSIPSNHPVMQSTNSAKRATAFHY